jgi:hypothetical protein
MYSLALIIFVVSETTWIIETKLHRIDHWKVLYKVYVFYADRISRWPPPQDID